MLKGSGLLRSMLTSMPACFLELVFELVATVDEEVDMAPHYGCFVSKGRAGLPQRDRKTRSVGNGGVEQDRAPRQLA